MSPTTKADEEAERRRLVLLRVGRILRRVEHGSVSEPPPPYEPRQRSTTPPPSPGA